MAIQIHLKIPGIEGESTHKGHEKEIEVRSWAWGVENAAKPGTGGGGAGKAVTRELVFTHGYDAASPLLAKSCAKGAHIAVATRAGAPPPSSATMILGKQLSDAASLAIEPGGGIVEFKMTPVDASATEVRRLLREPDSTERAQRLSAMVPAAVLDYIDSHHLYRD